MTIDTGGQAFPGQFPTGYDPRSGEFFEGMTLLDYFAAHAITKVMWNRLECTFAESAKCAYEIARAMLVERKRIIELPAQDNIAGYSVAGLVHRMAPSQPFVALCGADVANQKTTDFDTNVTCVACKAAMTRAEMIEETMDRR